jgi:hypothetical protein
MDFDSAFCKDVFCDDNGHNDNGENGSGACSASTYLAFPILVMGVSE